MTMTNSCKVVYAVVATAGSPFLNWTAAGAHVAKKLQCVSSVVLCTDTATLKLAKSTNHHLLNIVDDIVVAPEFKGTARERSRWVKTQLRSMVTGDFVFIDADAIPVAEFPEMFQHDADFAAVEADAPFSAIASWYVPAAAQLNWKINHELHYSSGVFFLRDNEAAHKFGRSWNKKWQEWKGIDKSGVFADQPSFNSAVFESEMSCIKLPTKFNVPLFTAFHTAEDARIFHYPASTRRTNHSLLETLSRQLAATGECDMSLVERARLNNNPWTGSRGLVQYDYFMSSARVYVTSQLRRRLPLAYRNLLVR
jgi:hypothetical protein